LTPGTSTLRQVTQPSSFSNSLTSTTTGVKPRSSSSEVVFGAAALIITLSPPRQTTWQPASSSTVRTAGKMPTSTRPGEATTVPSGSAVTADLR
jgi:hypothetical protein